MKALKEPTTNQAFLVIDLVDEGTPIKEAAQAAGVTVKWARAMAGNETLRKAVKELTTEDKYKAYELHEKGWSDARIARQLTTTKVKVIKAIAAIRDRRSRGVYSPRLPAKRGKTEKEEDTEMMTEKALTLEQLQKMRGKWVWIVSPDKDLTVSGWAYVGKDHVYTYWEYERDKLVGRVVYNICDYGAWLAYENPTAINPEDLPIVQQLRKELAQVTEERNAAIKVIQRRAGCFECAVLERKECSTPLYDHCGKWQWRGMQKDRQKLEPLTPAQVKAMDYEKIWIDYGDDGEWGIIVEGLLYSISTLEGAGFVDMLQDAMVRGEDVERPSGSYRMYRTQRIYEEESHAEAD